MKSELARAEVLGVDREDYPTAAKVRLHSLETGEPLELWAPFRYLQASGAGPTSSEGYGVSWAPNKGDMVWVTFLMGDINFPIILGGGWEGEASKNAPDTFPESLSVMASASVSLIMDTDEEKILMRCEPDKAKTATIALGKTKASKAKSARNSAAPAVKLNGSAEKEGFSAATPSGDISISCKQKIVLKAGGDVTISATGDCNAVSNGTASTSGNATLAPTAALIGNVPSLGA